MNHRKFNYGTPDQLANAVKAKLSEFGQDVKSCDNITSSKSSPKFTANSWSELVDTLERSGYSIDAAFLRPHKYNHEKYIIMYDYDGNVYEAEVTRYSDGSLEIMDYNIRPIDAATNTSGILANPDIIEASDDFDYVTEYAVDNKLQRYIHSLMSEISDLLEDEGYDVSFDDVDDALQISIWPIGEERCDGTYTFPKSALDYEGFNIYTDASNIVEILMGRAHFENFYANTEIVASDDYYFDLDDDEDEDSEWVEVDCKSVLDSDGFMTDYTMYRSTEDGTFIFMFGDKDLNRPSADYCDWSADTEKEAREWFDNYNGFEDYDEDMTDDPMFDDVTEVISSSQMNEMSWSNYVNHLIGKGDIDDEQEIVDILGIDQSQVTRVYLSKESDNYYTGFKLRDGSYLLDGDGECGPTTWKEMTELLACSTIQCNSKTHQVYFVQDGIEQIEFEGTEDECSQYINDTADEQAEYYEDEYPERYIRPIMSAVYNNPIKINDELTIWWDGGYADVEFIGRTRDGKYKFKSTTYGTLYLMDVDNNTITSPNGDTYEIDNSSGWLDAIGLQSNENPVYTSEDVSIQASFHFGEEEAQKYGDLISEKLAGKTISKRKDLGEEPGGLVYEANKLGIDMWDLLGALEGMCYDGRAREIDDSTYLVK